MSNERSFFGTTEEGAWEQHNLSQLKYFRSLSLREKLEAVQGMADVVRRLREMRIRGELKSSSGVEQAADTLPRSDASLSSAGYTSTSGEWSRFVMRMTPVDSTAIARIGYDPARHILRLQYTNDRIYDYFDVPPAIYTQLVNAESAGQFVNLEVKPNYHYSEVE